MSSQAFFWVNIGLGVILAIYFWRLRLRRSRKLNAQSGIFVYNGHTFDAYEVLGLPRNAKPQQLIEMAEKIALSESGDKQFLEAAIKSLI